MLGFGFGVRVWGWGVGGWIGLGCGWMGWAGGWVGVGVGGWVGLGCGRMGDAGVWEDGLGLGLGVDGLGLAVGGWVGLGCGWIGWAWAWVDLKLKRCAEWCISAVRAFFEPGTSLFVGFGMIAGGWSCTDAIGRAPDCGGGSCISCTVAARWAQGYNEPSASPPHEVPRSENK